MQTISSNSHSFKSGIQIWSLVLVATLLSGCGINNVPTFDEGVKAAWSQVLNQYKRRTDLIPNLVSTVKGFASHEKEVLTEVVEARSKVSQMNINPEMLNNPETFKAFEQNQAALSSALSRLMVVVERYPDLKSDKNFLALQSQLEGTENRIAVARGDYIQAVKKYNTELRTIPGRWIAGMLYPDAEVKPTFTVSEAEQHVPTVSFD
jgi:LemA protein